MKLGSSFCRIVYNTICRYTHTENLDIKSTIVQLNKLDIIAPSNNEFLGISEKRQSVLEDCNEDISHIATYLKPTFNLAAYVNKSDTLQQLVKLGVELYKFDKKQELSSYILTLDFEKDIKNHVIYLCDLGVPVTEIGNYITKNPAIFKEKLQDLDVRINYLKSKKFKSEMIQRIISKNPFWLMFSTQRIDRKLGFFQNEFSLNGQEVRFLTTLQPKLITYNIQHVKRNKFVFKEEMGFTPEETKSIILKKPNLFMKSQDGLLKTFEYFHRNMNIPLERIVEVPQVLTCRYFKVEQRDLFLKKLGRAQYNPKEPNYVSLVALVSGLDSDFAVNIAKSSVQTFNMFLKSL